MRLISQKSIGYIDVEYEKGVVFLRNEEKRTIVVYEADDRKRIVIATYDSASKAKRALNDMRRLYKSYIKCEGGWRVVEYGEYQPVFYTPPKIFEFQENDEMEE